MTTTQPNPRPDPTLPQATGQASRAADTATPCCAPHARTACCDAADQASCCDAADKAACCGGPEPATCRCR